MTQPRHLWSGDWQRESAEAAERFAAGRGSPAEPLKPPESPPVDLPPRVSLRDRLRAALGQLRAALDRLRAAAGRLRTAAGRVDTSRLPRNALFAIAMLLTAAAAYAAVSELRTTGTHSSTRPRSSSVSTSGPAWLGVDTANFPLASGAMVVNVVPSSPADTAGLEPGDVITAIDNRPVQSTADLQSALAGLHAGQRVQVTYEQGASSYTAEVTLRAHSHGP